jgi:hypothetical protein
MTPRIQGVIVGLALAGLVALVAATGEAGGEKATTWKAFLPDEPAQALAKRSLTRIVERTKKDAEPSGEVRAEALILVGYAHTVKDASKTAELRDGALALVQDAADPKGAEQMHMLAAGLAEGKTKFAEPIKIKDWPQFIGDIKAVMTLFESKAKKGEGLHSDLQYSPKIKNINGSEALIYALADKKLNDANAAKVSKELELLAYRVAVIGEMCRVRGPGSYPKSDKKDDKKPDSKIWAEQSVVMRDASIELAVAASKKDSAGILEACKKLENTCVECHAEFK